MRRVDCSASGLEMLARTLFTMNSVRQTGRRYSVTLLFSHHSCQRDSDSESSLEATQRVLLIHASSTK